MMKILKRNSTNNRYLKISNFEDLKLPIKNEQLRFITLKARNVISLIYSIISEKGNISECLISNSSIDMKAIKFLSEMIENKKISRIFIQINSSERSRKPEIIKALEEMELKYSNCHINLEKCHTKIICIKVKNNFYVLEGSGNISTNSRTEQYLLTNHEESFYFHKKWMTI